MTFLEQFGVKEYWTKRNNLPGAGVGVVPSAWQSWIALKPGVANTPTGNWDTRAIANLEMSLLQVICNERDLI